jgi:copper resistance protein B
MRSWIPLVLLASSVATAQEHNPAGAPSDWPMPVMDDENYALLAIDRLEYGDGDEGESLLWDAQAWYGGDVSKLWVETEGEGPTGESLEVAELQVLYDHAFSPFWSWRAGVRYDVRPGSEDTAYLTLGLQGLARQWFETDVALFLSEDGDLSLRGELEYDLLLTQRLILQPRLELDVSASDVAGRGVGSGISATAAGIRLRYEIRRELAPYVGVRWEQLYGDTRDMARDLGEPTSSTSFVVGITAWF